MILSNRPTVRQTVSIFVCLFSFGGEQLIAAKTIQALHTHHMGCWGEKNTSLATYVPLHALAEKHLTAWPGSILGMYIRSKRNVLELLVWMGRGDQQPNAPPASWRMTTPRQTLAVCLPGHWGRTGKLRLASDQSKNDLVNPVEKNGADVFKEMCSADLSWFSCLSEVNRRLRTSSLQTSLVSLNRFRVKHF